jgi:hypothetical protein
MDDSASAPSPVPFDPDPVELVPNPAQPTEWLVVKYCANGGLCVDTVASALYDEQVHGALAEAKTLGEFWLMLPDQEREALADFFIDALSEARSEGLDEDELPDDWKDRVFVDCESAGYWAQDRTPFMPEQISGFSDGDYPSWRQQTLDEVLPEDLLSEFATTMDSVHNGPFWFIPNESSTALINALRLRGCHVEETPFLRGW